TSTRPMCSGEGTRALPRVGFPIRTSPDQSLISSSPRLIAAVHVLHRLQVPRHPPCALHLLIQIENTTNRYGVFKVRAEERFRGPGKTATAPEGGRCRSLKTQQFRCRCRRIPGEPRDPDGIAAITTGAPRRRVGDARVLSREGETSAPRVAP